MKVKHLKLNMRNKVLTDIVQRTKLWHFPHQIAADLGVVAKYCTNIG